MMCKLKQPMQKLRIDSFRGCGKQLTVKSKCTDCDTPMTYTCKGCNLWSDDSPHDCRLFLN